MSINRIVFGTIYLAIASAIAMHIVAIAMMVNYQETASSLMLASIFPNYLAMVLLAYVDNDIVEKISIELAVALGFNMLCTSMTLVDAAYDYKYHSVFTPIISIITLILDGIIGFFLVRLHINLHKLTIVNEPQ